MDEIIDDLVRAAQRCERVAEAFEAEPLTSIRQRLVLYADSLLPYAPQSAIDGAAAYCPSEAESSRSQREIALRTAEYIIPCMERRYIQSKVMQHERR